MSSRDFGRYADGLERDRRTLALLKDEFRRYELLVKRWSAYGSKVFFGST